MTARAALAGMLLVVAVATSPVDASDYFTMRGDNGTYRAARHIGIIAQQVELSKHRFERAVALLGAPEPDVHSSWWIADDGYRLLRAAHEGVLGLLQNQKYPSPLLQMQADQIHATREVLYDLNGPLKTLRQLIEHERTHDTQRVAYAHRMLVVIVDRVTTIRMLMP